MKQRNIGIILLVLAIIMSVNVIFYTIAIRNATMDSCPFMADGKECPHRNYIPWQGFLGGFLVIIVVVIGLYLLIEKNDFSTQNKMRAKKVMSSLKGDEKKLYKFIVEAEGAIMQSDLVKQSDFNKVKVSRVLDKLEGKRLVERKRRGMSNLVVLK